MLKETDPSFKYYFCLHANETLMRLEQTPKLCIAALNGHTIGGGLEVALACDLRIGRKGSFLVGLPEVDLGVLPGTGGTQRLARLLGKGKAMELMVEGKKLSFEEGERIGIINRQCEGDTAQAFLAKVTEYAHSFVPPNRAGRAVGRIKRAVQSGLEMSLGEGLAFERELQADLFSSSDAKEGFAAYTEKRTPHFRGQ